MSRFELVKSFQIDNGELDGLRPQDCFVLGYELAMIDHLLLEPAPILRPVHAENRARIEASCKDACRLCQFSWMSDDASERWLRLEVPAKEGA